MRHDKIELSDITPKHDKSIIELYKNRASIGHNKVGTLNYIIDDEKMYITKQPIGYNKNKSGRFDEVLTRNKSGVIDGDLIIDGDITVDNFTINGKMTNKDYEKITVKKPIIEINSNEQDEGISLKRSGISINRGTSGSANIFYDENSDGFIFCLDDSRIGHDVKNSNVISHIEKMSQTDDPQVFKYLKDIDKNSVTMIFINSIKILEEDEYTIDIKNNSVKILEPIEKGTELTMVNISMEQVDASGEVIPEDSSYLEKHTFSTITNEYYENEIILNLRNENMKPNEVHDIKDSILLVFLNGTLLSPKFYTIDDKLGDRATFQFSKGLNVDSGSQLYFVSMTPRYNIMQNRIYFNLDKDKIATPEIRSFTLKNTSDKILLPITIEDKDSILIFVNSVLLDFESYTVEDDVLKMIGATIEKESVIEVVKLSLYNTAPDLSTMSYLLNKEDFKVLMELKDDQTLVINKLDSNYLRVRNYAEIDGLKVNQKIQDKNALHVNGSSLLSGNVKIERDTDLNGKVNANSRLNTFGLVTHHNNVIHSKPYIYLNDSLESEDGGIIFEREMAAHSVIKWKEHNRRWYAGIEGSEKPIVTMDVLELMFERFMDLAGIDLDVHTSLSIKHQDEIVLQNNVNKEDSSFFTFPKRRDKVLLVFMNGRYISEEEYVYTNDQVFFNGNINKGTIINFVQISLDQVSLTGYPIKEEVSLNKEYVTIKAKNSDHNVFELPYSISPHNNANLFFLNGILMTRELYDINGHVLTLNFNPMMPTEITIITLNASKGATSSKVNLVNRSIKLEASQPYQKEFILPTTLKEEKDNFLVFCNTTYIPNHLYEIKDRKLKLINIEKRFVNPPTEISIVELLPVTQRTINYGLSSGGKGSSDINTKTYSDVIPANEKYIILPFSIEKHNMNKMIFVDGKILNTHEYKSSGRLLELKDVSTKERSLYVVEFSSLDSAISDGLTMKGTRFFEDELKNDYTIHLPFVIIGSEDTNLIFADGVLLDKNKYEIENNKIFIDKSIKLNSMIKIINFSNVRNLEYAPAQHKEEHISKKIIINHDEEKDIWKIEHNLNTYPSIIAIDDKNQVIDIVRTTYPDTNSITIEFEQPVKGKVVLS